MKTALKNFAADLRVEDYIKTAAPTIRSAGSKALEEINHGGDKAGKFWFELNLFVQLLTPIYELLRMGDGVVPCMSKFLNGFIKLPDKFDKVWALQEMVANAIEGEGWKDPNVTPRLDLIKEKAAHHLHYVWPPMVSAAFGLDPEYRKVDLSKINGGQILLDINTMCERLLTDHGDDSEAAIEAAADEEGGGPVGRAGAQFAKFRTGKWEGGRLLSLAKGMSPADWWATYGIGMPELRKVAMPTTSKIPASAGSERNSSLYGGRLL